jgi:predicted AAA+ superfamily ATPase
MLYIPRLLRTSFDAACAGFPAVLVTGPRQSGKTTFLRQRDPDLPYVSFDDPLQRQLAREDPNALLDRGTSGMILDEIQQVPELLQHLKLRIDADRHHMGAWRLTGSQHFSLMQGVSETLAGRIAVLDLLPLALAEHRPERLAEAVWVGGYPDPALRPAARDLWMTSYLRTYVERDVRQVRDVQDLRRFEQFLTLAAAHHGQELRAARLSRDVGVSIPTIQSWISVLSASYVTFLLPAWYRNLGKRVVKSPKLYFVDSGLACTLTRQPGGEAALAGPMGGPLFEGLIVVEALKLFAAAGRQPALHFWRSHDGMEVDLIVEVGGRVVPVEIKLTATPTARHADSVRKLGALVGDEADPGLVVCHVTEPTMLPGGVTALPWRDWPGWLATRLGLGQA